MAYIFKQKLQISDLVDSVRAPKKVLIHEPESYLSALYGHYLEAHNFDIKHCPDLSELKAAITAFGPELLILNVDAQSGRALPINFKKEFPSLLVVTTGYNLASESLKDLMNYGVCSHLNRRHSRPQDLVTVVVALLKTNY